MAGIGSSVGMLKTISLAWSCFPGSNDSPGFGENLAVDLLFCHVGVLDGVVHVIKLDETLGERQPVVANRGVGPGGQIHGRQRPGNHPRRRSRALDRA